MGVFITGIIGIAVFYIVILAVAIWASRKAKNSSEEEMMLAGRQLGFSVGTLTLIATWVGGGYVNGASEIMFTKGLLWLQVPVGYSLSLFVGALLFVKPLRDMKAVTLLDPFQKKYGNRVGGLLFVPAILGDIFWVASILSALGSSLVVITDIDPVISVIASAVVVAAYTSFGAMYSVTYTDVVQMFFILAGLVLCVPFASQNAAVDFSRKSEHSWIGHIEKRDVWLWIDNMLLIILGGIPWQGYVQRVLSIRTTRSAKYLSMFSTLGCMAMAIPAIYIGVVARFTDWTLVPSFNRTITTTDYNEILPLVLRHLTPEWVAFFGLGAISAAVMSSADSSILAFSACFSRNIYKNLLRQKASQAEIAVVLRVTVVGISAVAATIALTAPSIYYLAILSSDLIYVILFPHLVLLIYTPGSVNAYGCVASFFIGIVLRVLGGERGLGISATIRYPGYDYDHGQLFPHRTFAMLVVLISHFTFSRLAKKISTSGRFSKSWDVLEVFDQDAEKCSMQESMKMVENER